MCLLVFPLIISFHITMDNSEKNGEATKSGVDFRVKIEILSKFNHNFIAINWAKQILFAINKQVILEWKERIS